MSTTDPDQRKDDKSIDVTPANPAVETVTATAPAAPHGAAQLPVRRKVIDTALILALLALLLIGIEWFSSYRSFNRIEQDLAKRLADMDTQNKKSQIIASQAQEATREATVKLGILEDELNKSQNQQMAIEALYQEVSRSRDEWVLAEVEQILLMANQQVQLAGNVKAALIGLQTADSRLQRLDKPHLLDLRKAINKDIERLQALPFLDISGINLRLEALTSSIDQLPLNPGRTLKEIKEAAPPETGNTWTKLWKEIWGEIKQLVRISNTQKSEVPLLLPSQSYFLKENLRLRLLSARIALVQHDGNSFISDVSAAEEWINRYFDINDHLVKSALTTLRQLKESPISLSLPDISNSLSLVRNYKLARERGPH